MKMLLFILYLGFISICCGEVCDCSDGSTFTREQAWNCIENVVDTNHDRKIDANEIETSKQHYLFWYERAIGWIVGPTTVEHIQATCDYNKDGYIDSNDYDAMKTTCMPYYDPDYPNQKVKIDALCKLKGFCDRAAKLLNKNVY